MAMDAVALRRYQEDLRVCEKLRANGVMNPTNADVLAYRKAQQEAEAAAFAARRKTWPEPPVEPPEQAEARRKAQWLAQNAQVVDLDYDAGMTVARVRASTSERSKARRDAERKRRVDAFEASLRGSNR